MNTGFKSKILASESMTVENSTPVIKFIRPAARNYPKDGWDRYLFLEDKPAFYLGTVCETCYFIFRKVPGDFAGANTERISEKLNRGLTSIDEVVLLSVSELLQSGEYGAFLIELLPVLVQPESDDDYFSHRIYNDFGDDDFNSVHAEYYRTETKVIDDAKSVYEFVVPMFDHRTLNQAQVEFYRKSLREGRKPTALAVSILDTKCVSNFDDYVDLIEYPICLAHFILDGHHKLYAAALEKLSITLLSVVSKAESVWYEDGIGSVLQNVD
jgi:hypothetical protein